MKKLYCRECGGILIPNGNSYICEDCREEYSLDEIKAQSMQISVKRPVIAAKKEVKDKKIEVKPFKLEKANVIRVEEKKTIKLKKKPIKEEEPTIKRVRVINPVGVGEDPKDGVSNDKSLKTKVNENEVMNSLLILAKDAMEGKQYDNAIMYADKILKIDDNNRNAHLIKGEALILKDSSIVDRLSLSIFEYHNALINTREDEYKDLEFRLSNKYIEVSSSYLISKLEGFKKEIDIKYLDILKKEIKILDDFAKIATKEINLDIKEYYEAMARAVINLVGASSDRAIKKFNLERIRQTDSEYLLFKERMDACILIWEYVLGFAMRAKTINEALRNLYNAHHAIINSCGHKLSGKRLKVSISATKEEKSLREAKIIGYKKSIMNYFLTDEDKFIYSSYEDEIKKLESEGRRINREINNAPELKEIKDLKEFGLKLSQSGRFKEAKENLSKINSLYRSLLSKKRDSLNKLEVLDRKILYLNIENLYLNLD